MTSATGKTMSLETRPRSHAGFTMVELLVTISLIVFLMSMLAVGAGRYLENTSAKATEALIARIGLNLGTYNGSLDPSRRMGSMGSMSSLKTGLPSPVVQR